MTQPLISTKQNPNETIDLLLRRRSIVVAKQTESGPTDEDLSTLLRCAIRVPDHGKLAPWRIQVVNKEAQLRLGEAFAEIFKKHNPEVSAERLELERQRPARAPLLLIVSTKIEAERIPRCEQILSGGALCQNILIAATALGYASQWLSEWPNYNEDAKAHLGVAPADEILGFIYIGRAAERPEERPRPDLNAIVSYL